MKKAIKIRMRTPLGSCTFCATIANEKESGFLLKCGLACPNSQLSRLYSWFSLSSFLAGIFEGALNKWRNIILIVDLGLAAGFLAEFTHQVLEGFILLWTDLLDDVRNHVFELFGLWISSDNEKVFAHGELN